MLQLEILCAINKSINRNRKAAAMEEQKPYYQPHGARLIVAVARFGGISSSLLLPEQYLQSTGAQVLGQILAVGEGIHGFNVGDWIDFAPFILTNQKASLNNLKFSNPFQDYFTVYLTGDQILGRYTFAKGEEPQLVRRSLERESQELIGKVIL